MCALCAYHDLVGHSKEIYMAANLVKKPQLFYEDLYENLNCLSVNNAED
jgi:hypothetical protein